MGNIIGEGFKKYVTEQIKVRQEKLALRERNTQTLLEQNSKSAWIKLTSSILVSERAKFGVPSGIDDIAEYYTLFGGTAIHRVPLGGLDAYTKFGFEQGYRPAPGIVSLETKNRNRGSVRETTIQIKAYSREQFYYIDLLYLRLGYSVLVEFGHSLYFDNNGNFKEFTENNTVTSDFLGKEASKYKGDHYALINAIEQKRNTTAGNYDAIFGQIRNFDWSLNPDGHYDITLSIISYGDVIESLKANVQSPDEKAVLTAEEKKELENIQSALDKAETDKQVIDILRNLDVIGNLAWKIKNALANENAEVLSDPNLTYLKDPTETFNFIGYEQYDGVRLVNHEDKSYGYYIRFGALLQYLWDTGMLYVDTEKKNPITTVDLDIDNNLIYKTPYTFSSNPNICVVKTNLELNINGSNFGTSILKEFPSEMLFDVDGRKDAGKVLNVYLNLAYILKQSRDLVDDKGNVSFYDLIKKLCDSIGQCLGGVNTLEPVIDEQEFRLYILDQHPIPSIQAEVKDLAEFSIYGLTPGKQGSFVTDFGIKTSITNALASTITIGAQANGAVKGADATAFATWNKGLEDRILLKKENKDTDNTNLDAQTKLEVRNRTLQEEYYNFVQSMQKYEWTEEKANEFGTILTNMISFTEAASGLSGDGTKGGSLGFIPINLNLTFDGLSGMKIYQRFKVSQDFLPYNYPNTLHFLIKGISHEVSNNKWITKLDTVVVPATITTNATQAFTGVGQGTNTTGTGTGTASTQNTGTLAWPTGNSSGLRLKLRRTSDDGVQTTGELQLLDASGKVLYTYKTVERPWKGNANRVSCIPPGTYRFTKSKANNNPGLGEVLRLSDPPYRQGVLVHVGTKPTDSEGCILPQLKSGGSRAAMKQILDTLYPAGAAPQTYTLEVYGVPGKTYQDVRNDKIYENPSAGPSAADVKKSRDLYIYYVEQLETVMKLQDRFDAGKPLLEDAKGLVDNTAEASRRIRSLFGIIDVRRDGRRVPWYKLLEPNELVAEHKKLLVDQVKLFAGAVQGRSRFFFFKYPDLGDQKNQSKPMTVNF